MGLHVDIPMDISNVTPLEKGSFVIASSHMIKNVNDVTNG